MEEKTKAKPQTQVSWLRGLDGVRGIACMMIISAHVITFLVAPGFAAPTVAALWYVVATQSLTMFFAMSGFLLYRPFAKAILLGTLRPNTRDFYTGRVLRVMPANVVILLIAGVAVGAATVQLLPGTAQAVEIGRVTDPMMLITNMFLIQGYFPSTVLTGLGASWSLVVEVMFYLLLPPLGWMAWRLSQRIPMMLALLSPALLLYVIGSICRQIGYAKLTGTNQDYGPTWTTVFQRSFIANCDLIALGMAVAAVIVVLNVLDESDRLALRVKRWSYAAIVVGLLFVAAIHADPYIAPFAGVACAGFLALMTMPHPGYSIAKAQWFFELRPIRYLGEISYSVYLWHFALILFVCEHFDSALYNSLPELVVLWIVLSVITVALGSITFYLVEAPAMRHAKHMAHRRRAASGVRTSE